MQKDTTLGERYRLERRLAAGGMGEVWLARDTSLNREVAVKLLAVGAQEDAAAVERFRREAQTMAGLQHPNIVSIFDAGSYEGSTFIVMELLSGPTLAEVIAGRGPLPEPEVLTLATQIAAGLGAAHHAGIIHRDLKPSNLMFDSSGHVKILDFGISRLAQATTSRLTATNAIIGSPSYLSPEQATGAPADERSDLYSLGCMLTAMLTGSPPFIGEHPVALLHQHVHEDPPPLRHRVPAVSPALESLVERLLEKRPELRPQSAEIVERELAIIAKGDGTPADLTPLAATREMPATLIAGPDELGPAPTLVQPSTLAKPPSGTVQNAPRQRRRPWAIAIAALIAAAALSGVILTPLLTPYFETTGTPTPTPTATRKASPTPSTPSPTPRTTPTQLTSSPSPRTTPTRPRPKAGKSPHPKKHHDPRPKHGRSKSRP